MAAHIIAISNQKGGVGKTTSAVSLGAALAEAGQRVLLVDLDPQGNATLALGFNKADLTISIYEVLAEGLSAASAVAQSRIPNLQLLPANQHAAGLELDLATDEGRESQLRLALEPLRHRYDYILIDCPPSLGLLTINALVAADTVLVPLQCEFLALEGLAQLMNTVRLVQARANPRLRLEGVLLTMYDGRTNLAREVEREVRAYFQEPQAGGPQGKVFTTVIPRSIRLAEAPSHGQPISEYDPNSPGAQAYRQLAHELIQHEATPV
ncbi:MAG TPA: ParA family protein, partial [bacterium]|nr:ParA family protein [bacterium]